MRIDAATAAQSAAQSASLPATWLPQRAEQLGAEFMRLLQSDGENNPTAHEPASAALPRVDKYLAAYKVRDPSLPLNESGLPFNMFSGQIEVTVFRGGLSDAGQTHTVPINTAGNEHKTTLADVAAALNQIDGLSAEVTPEGRLEIRAAAQDVTFAVRDSGNGALKALGRDDPQRREAFMQFVGQTFFGQMLSSMRKTLDKPKYLHGGQAEEIFTGQLDQVLAEKLATAQGGHFAESLYEQAFLRERL
ncbi:MAG: rod-binding protein [Planctomycetia bacterium]|nr:rod-binding protein [Planctomycetia bacterium]